MLSLHTNIAALNTKSNLTGTQNALSTSMTRLGTGFRINSAMDDAAGLQIATRLDAQSRGMTVAMKNAQNGISMLQTAEGALNEVTNILQRMKDLSTEGATATATAADKKAMQAEFDALGKELGNIMNNTTFGGEKLLKSGVLSSEMKFQIGSSSQESMSVDTSAGMTSLLSKLDAVSAAVNGRVGTSAEAIAIKDTQTANEEVKAKLAKLNLENGRATPAAADITAAETALDASITALKTARGTPAAGSELEQVANKMEAARADYMTAATGSARQAKQAALEESVSAFMALAGGGAGDEITGAGNAAGSIDKINAALTSAGDLRSALGANANRLDHVINNLSNVNNNTLAAKGRIMDTDYANESASMTSKQMLMQASTSMLKQSGSMSSMAMSLLQ